MAPLDIVIYHNPECGTSRNALAMIRNAGIEPHVVEYLKTPPSRALLESLIERAGISPRALLREKGTPYAELGLGEPESACWESPFEFAKQALLYAPLGMPDPNAWNFTDAVVDAAFPAAKAAGDRRPVAAMAIDDHQPPYPRPCDRGGNVPHDPA
mgnify:CR=1 FL=1